MKTSNTMFDMDTIVLFLESAIEDATAPTWSRKYVPTCPTNALNIAFKWVVHLEQDGGSREDVDAALDLVDETRQKLFELLGERQTKAEQLLPLFSAE